MMKVSQKIQYAYAMACYLEEYGKTSIPTLAKKLDLPETFLVQVAHVMKRKGFLRSTIGPAGGYTLARETWTPYDVFAIFDDMSWGVSKKAHPYFLSMRTKMNQILKAS